MTEEKKKRTRRKHTQETKDLISMKRRARTVQPRNSSQSTKSKSLYDELKSDYKKDKNALKWIEENKEKLGFIDTGNPLQDSELMIETAKNWGIKTEFSEMYDRTYEHKLGDMIFSSDDIDGFADSEINPLNILLERESNGFSDEL